ncbi:HTH-type transcriptional regulator PksA [Paenibacillus faecis]|uniref:TetR family transcriptional regulator n=1 Tax=Paenibacillus faecis TaxID=862114 RepID=A0A5D0CY16_9BACL|nr:MULTISPECIES: TetR/AcrR family transcriptional regulator [Paenibacillus]MCA1291481.1 TetR family transcriptional regulator [Paenibacillus sp. alder61]TYA14648.1 TetR family transcriptional regulator [Paenibacillus faecis]GIO84158.1 HTH-type transcriptional regulator PksA [Paenibacillus faecis]
MPKIVDHDKQKRLVAEAALNVIRESGLERATVRRIAEEAGLSVGSMRHYFASQEELFAFCMNLFVERVEKRLAEFELHGPLLHDLKRMLLQFLPVDEERTLEMEVWFSFSAKTLVYPELKRLSLSVQDGLLTASRFALHELVASGMARSGLDVELEAEKLYALVDGLAVHRLMQPERLDVDRIESIIEQHLRSLCVSAD